MGRQNQPASQQLFQEASRKVCVPRVAVNDIGFLCRACHRNFANKSVQQTRVAQMVCRIPQCGVDSPHLQVPLLQRLVPETENADAAAAWFKRREFPHEILNVHSRPAIYMRGIFIGKD